MAVWMANRFGSTFPWGTLTVNVAGGFLIGLLARWPTNLAAADRRHGYSSSWAYWAAFLPTVHDMVSEGLVTLENVNVIIYRGGKG